MRKKKIILAVYILLLVVTVSFAWMSVIDNTGDYMELEYGGDSGNTLSVASKDVEMMVWAEMEPDEWKYLGSSEDDQKGTLMTIPGNRVIPGSNIPFKIQFTNSSDKPVAVRIILNGSCHKDLVQQADGNDRLAVLFVAYGTGSFTKYSEVVPAPARSSVELRDNCMVAKNTETGINSYTIELYDSIQIPPTAQGEFVEVMCTVNFDMLTMTNECAGKTFTISSFGATQK